MAGKIIDEDVLKLTISNIMQTLSDYIYIEEEYDDDSINSLFDVKDAQELSYYESLIQDSNISSNRIWSSSKVKEEIAKSIIESNNYSDGLLANISSIELKYVTSLPTTGNSNTIYILKSTDTNPDTLNLYNDSAWISIGQFTISLDDYYNKTEIDGLLDTKANDNEVLKLDKVLTTTTGATNDNVLSATTTIEELNKKANDDEVLKKTNISTTLDSSSTNDKVPTSKTVWDSLYKICDPQVLVDANNPTSKICMADLTTLNTPAKEGVTSAESSLIISIEGRDYWNGQISIAMAEPEVYVRSVRDVGTWTKWRRLCTTSVADVPKTNITNNLVSTKVSLPNSDSYATYYVKNGTCYVTIWSMTILAACSVETIFNDLPKSAIGATCPLCNGEESFAQVFISPDSKVIAFNASATTINKNGYCSFSYPVAES